MNEPVENHNNNNAVQDNRLADAIREIKNAVADRDDVVVDIREAQRTRLELLAEDLQPVFRQVSRILKDGGVFGFVVGDRRPEEAARIEVKHAGSRAALFRHCRSEILAFLGNSGFELLGEAAFAAPGHEGGGPSMRLKAVAARRAKRLDQAGVRGGRPLSGARRSAMDEGEGSC